MNNDKSDFCSKILLFGEYLVVKGARAIAVDYHHFSGSLDIQDKVSSKDEHCLKDFGEFISNSNILARAIDSKKLKADIERGLSFNSNIPSGHGVGSSGALCASIFSKYNLLNDSEKSDLGYLKDILSLMESYFHGISSGLDPLVSLIQRPIEIRNRNEFRIIEGIESQSLSDFYLVDTQISRKTAPLVHNFLKLCDKQEFKNPLLQMMEYNNDLIESFLNGDNDNLQKSFYQLSYLQYIWFDKMIPAKFRKFWLDSLESKKYLVKLCGAGGGGFLLVYAKDTKVLKDQIYYPLV